MSNCKVGDLAIVVRDMFPENIGRVVEIMGPAKFVLDAPAWLCEVRGEPLRILWLERAPETYLGCVGEAYDADLMAISGLPVTDDIPDEITA